MHVPDLATAKRLLKDRSRSSIKTGKKLRRANSLLREFVAHAHDLPEIQRPAQLLERARVHLHSAEAEAGDSQ